MGADQSRLGKGDAPADDAAQAKAPASDASTGAEVPATDASGAPEHTDELSPDMAHILQQGVAGKQDEQSLERHRELVAKLRSQGSDSQEERAAAYAELEAMIHRDDDANAADREDTSDEEAHGQKATQSETDDDDESDDDDDEDDDDESDSTEDDTEVNAAPAPLAEDDAYDAQPSTAPRTKHEIEDPEVPPPPIAKLEQPELSQIRALGRVHSIVDNVVLVEQQPQPSEGAQSTVMSTASAPATMEVLDSESLLCFDDGKVLGLVYETFGSVLHPMYTVRFPSSEAIDRDTVHLDRKVYFLPGSSTVVLTKAIRNKGSDASNMWDEEVAEDEVEFSDDEEEAAAKRRRRNKQNSKSSEPSTAVDPNDLEAASLGPLGGAQAGAGSSRKRKEPRRGPGARRGRETGPAPYAPYEGHGYAAPSFAPHINPRFAGQWFRGGSGYAVPSPGSPYSAQMPYMYPPGMFAPPYSSGAYHGSPGVPFNPSGQQYDPHAPDMDGDQRRPSGQ